MNNYLGTTPPTEPGWYWYCTKHGAPQPVLVRMRVWSDRQERLTYQSGGIGGVFNTEHSYHGDWWGPIEVPPKRQNGG